MTTETTSAVGPGRGGRMSRQRKRDAVLGLLRGEDLETVSRALGVTAATLSGWRDAFLAAGEASLSTRPAGGQALESERLKARLGRCPALARGRPRAVPGRVLPGAAGRGRGGPTDRGSREAPEAGGATLAGRRGREAGAPAPPAARPSRASG